MDFSSHPKLLAVLMSPIDQVRGNGVAVLSLENSKGPLSLYRNFQETFFFQQHSQYLGNKMYVKNTNFENRR